MRSVPWGGACEELELLPCEMDVEPLFESDELEPEEVPAFSNFE